MSSKLFILIVALVVLQQSISAVEFPRIAVKSPFSITTFSSKFPQTCDPVGIYTVCTTCSSTMVCIQGDMTRKACPLDKPYCNNNVCSTTISSEYGCTPDPLKCTGIGFYPDPKACQFYHYCEAVGDPSTVYDCQPNNVFNAATLMCKQRKLATDCVTVTCDPGKIFQSYGTSKTYFAFCSGSPVGIEMLKCDTNYVFNGSGCVFQCPKEGNFAHHNPEKFYECVYSGTKLVAMEISCPEGKEFDAVIGICLTPSA
ncbi:uncharacterized protein LOC6047124 isoform X1 [Culex quinquefasciatus]|uniref:uncharacterized protein LOC6047124 isoform X1 n=2 Tax=Culex quinquefasciatus TaxID=7176 RepID=UPI0018E2AF08|nr:uncharacterized protein LOC6047124 isoform X1 [Culex quinquefasciatus]